MKIEAPSILIHFQYGRGGSLKFDSIPSHQEILERADKIMQSVPPEYEAVLIGGGAQWLQGPLENAARIRDITPEYAFSQRQSIEQHMPDGSVKKQAVFKYEGMVEGQCETPAMQIEPPTVK